MNRRLFVRTLRFVAYNWFVPFVAGIVTTMLVITWDLLWLSQALEIGFTDSIKAVVAQCAL